MWFTNRASRGRCDRLNWSMLICTPVAGALLIIAIDLLELGKLTLGNASCHNLTPETCGLVIFFLNRQVFSLKAF